MYFVKFSISLAKCNCLYACIYILILGSRIIKKLGHQTEFKFKINELHKQQQQDEQQQQKLNKESKLNEK